MEWPGFCALAYRVILLYPGSGWREHWGELWLLSQIQLYPVIPVAKEKLVDTNGAGDAFVGGEAERLPCQRSPKPKL